MKHDIDFNDSICRICQKACKNRRSIANHLTRKHKIKLQEYVRDYFFGGKPPECACGCGESVKWHKTLCVYNKFLTGHNPSNFIGYKHPPEVLDRRNQSIRRRYKTDEELKQLIAVAVTKTLSTPEAKKKMQENSGWRNPDNAEKNKKRKDVLRIDVMEKQADGRMGPHAPFKTEWKHNPFTDQKEYMHSSWESTYLDHCITEGRHVTKNHGLSVPYTHEGEDHVYYPDFWHPDEHTLCEVKGREDPVDLSKYQATLAWCKAHNFRFKVIRIQRDGTVTERELT